MVTCHMKLVCYIAHGHKAMLANGHESGAARDLAWLLSQRTGWFTGL